MGMPADEYDVFASIALFDAVNDGFRVFACVCRFDSEPKGEWGVWFLSTSAPDIETVGLDFVSIHKLLGLKG